MDAVVEHELSLLRARVARGDLAACVRLADALLAHAPYRAPDWEGDSRWVGIRCGERESDRHLTETIELGRYALSRENAQALWCSRLARERREEELGCGTPGRREMLAEASHVLALAAFEGDSAAMFRLGYRHWLGQGVPVDEEAAKYWWRRAAEAGHSRSGDLLYHLLLLPESDPVVRASRGEVSLAPLGGPG